MVFFSSFLLLLRRFYLTFFINYRYIVIFCEPVHCSTAVCFVVITVEPSADSSVKELFNCVMFVLTIMVFESFVVFSKFDCAVFYFAVISLNFFFWTGSISFVSCIWVVWPVSSVEVVSKVTVSAALFLAKAAVPFVLSFLSRNDNNFTCEFFSHLSVFFLAFFTPSCGSCSPLSNVFSYGYYLVLFLHYFFHFNYYNLISFFFLL